MVTFETWGVAPGSRIFKIYMCMCVRVPICMRMHTTAHVWKSEGNPQHKSPSTLPETESLAVQHSAQKASWPISFRAPHAPPHV